MMATVIELAPSVLSANFARLGADAKAALEGGGTVLHLDVMRLLELARQSSNERRTLPVPVTRLL